MAYTKQFYKATWLWTVADEEEVAQTGLHIGATSGASVTDPAGISDAEMEDLVALMEDLWSAGSGLKLADYGNLVGAKVAAVGTDGHYLFGPKVYSQAPVSASGTDVPPQVSAVITLRSADSLTSGRANYGRMYLPYCMLPNGVNARASTAQRDALAAAGAAFIGGVNAWANTVFGGAWAVQNLSNLGSGTSKTVTRCGAGRVNDTQRRRRAQLSEELSYVAV